MSATNRGAERMPADNYPTPAWCVRRLLEAVDLPSGRWIEPACGDGAIIRSVLEFRDEQWTAVDRRYECRSAIESIGNDASFEAWDFPSTPSDWDRFDVAITNPPFSLAQDFIYKCLNIADVTVMLLRLNYIGSERRAAFMRSNPPDVYVLPNRPAFVNGKTDSCEYAWFVWGQGGGRVRVLSTTPAAERRQA